jgi:signal transduction histidine kinase
MAAGVSVWRARWARYFLKASPHRTYSEVLALGVLLSLFSALLYGERGQSLYTLALMAFVNPLCALHYGLRLRVAATGGNGWAQFGYEAACLGGAWVICKFFGVAAVALGRLGQPDVGASDNFAPLLFMAVALSFPYLFFRAFARFWVWWAGLRRRRLVWSLMHSHHLAVALIQSLIILPIMLHLMASSATPWIIDSLGTNIAGQFFYRLNVTLLVLGLTILASLLILLVLSPASALVSYFLARRMRQRFDALIATTHAARAGRYEQRVVISGEDEISQMQTDFNTMLTGLEETIRALDAEQHKVTRLLQLRQELFANVSHDLRTPLATLSVQLEGMANAPTATPQVPALQHEVALLTRLVDDLFSLARADTQQLALRIAPTDVRAVILNAVQSAAPLAWQSGRVEVSADVPLQLPLMMADGARLEQTLRNLIHNGQRYTLPGGIVVVSARAEDDVIHIRVRDTGGGIAPGELPHIWERYYHDPEGGGTGLGLTLAKAFVESVGGSIDVESRLGEGTCFTLILRQFCDTSAKVL